MSRPEHVAPPEVFYNEAEAEKYLTSSRMIEVQTQLADRCLQLLQFEEGEERYLLDIGCGTGLSGDVLTDKGHVWVGLDISGPMLHVATARDVEGDLVERDAGEDLPFQANTFDGAISVSAIQWLCNVDQTGHNPRKRLLTFFEGLYRCLRKSARAALQFYPENANQLELITASAMRAGFSGGLIVDFPNSAKAKKYFLCLSAGPPDPNTATPLALDSEEAVKSTKRERPRKRKGREKMGAKAWILKKKERQRRQGKEVRPDSKYSGRKRSKKF
ncbi:hypothetical protein NDN08_001696 [Rhodosorus marinus]|uniref:18S rRNA (guanine(1575)-N(7))-methyltransferase Bud23 C-terminal domain-containing protein n=1 Tax=Rhodosorus marinus TaxID=101924 RepID=A0AAV8UVT2_9RHOD|nr:hypothetical protein NDN08_001696 [Rhodosorus marinus]